MTNMNMDNLNTPQLEAVQHTEGPLLILAGAGTGKTKVLTHRIAHIISSKLATPNQIIAVTFTNKAANEMKERVNDIIFSDGITIGTFHSIACKMLRSNIDLLDIGVNSNFNIINQDEQIKLIKTISVDQNIDIKQFAPRAICSIISRWKDQAILPHQISENDITSQIISVAKVIYHQYQENMHRSNVLDFGDLLLYANQVLINHPDILEYYQNKFCYILVDEYQDTNPVQYLWIRMLASKHNNICCVGDDDQSIYSWRGAEVKNILRFQQDFSDAKIIKLEQNYRSTKYILEAASSIIANNNNRHGKKLWTDQNAGNKIKVISCWSDKEEARFITHEILHFLKSKKYLADQIAILVRAGFQTRIFEEYFINNALPYQIIGGFRFYERQEIRDLLAYIRLSLNHSDNIALERIINLPKRSIGGVTLKKIRDFAYDNDISMFDAIDRMIQESILTGKLKVALQDFVSLIIESKESYDKYSAFEATKALLEKSGYANMLKLDKNENSSVRLENLNELLNAIDEFPGVNDFLEHASLVSDNESLENNFGGSVKIMTLHAAKGLEFNLVFLPGWEENIFPHQKALVEQGEPGLAEERRIAYVGITRAKEELYITYAKSRRMFAEIINSNPSRFLSEIPADLCIIENSTIQNPMSSLRSSSMRQQNFMNSQTKNNMINANLAKGNIPISRVVTHIKFGRGVVLKTLGDTLEIAFDNFGIKTIQKDYVVRSDK